MVKIQTFSDNKKIYSVDMIFAYINIFKPKYVKVNVQNYLSTLEYNGWGNKKHSFSPKNVIDNPKKYKDDYNRILNANLKYPIVIANDNIVDGVHRLTKAYLENKKQIKAYIFNGELLEKFLVDKNKNWEKVDKLNTWDFIELFYKKFCI